MSAILNTLHKKLKTVKVKKIKGNLENIWVEDPSRCVERTLPTDAQAGRARIFISSRARGWTRSAHHPIIATPCLPPQPPDFPHPRVCKKTTRAIVDDC